MDIGKKGETIVSNGGPGPHGWHILLNVELADFNIFGILVQDQDQRTYFVPLSQSDTQQYVAGKYYDLKIKPAE